MTEPDTPEDSTDKPDWKAWVREHRYPTAILICFIIAGMVIAPLVVPGVHPALAVIGGGLFGVFCTFCVALPKLLE